MENIKAHSLEKLYMEFEKADQTLLSSKRCQISAPLQLTVTNDA